MLSINKKTSMLYAAALLVGLGASGCTPNKIDQQLVAEADPVALRLAIAADRASGALQTLASIEQARNPNASIQATPDAPQELRRTFSVNWVGPIEPLAQRLADRAGYLMQVNGDKPPVPVVVSVEAREKTVVDVLRDIGLQAGRRADIVVDVERKIVELNYAPVSGS